MIYFKGTLWPLWLEYSVISKIRSKPISQGATVISHGKGVGGLGQGDNR